MKLILIATMWINPGSIMSLEQKPEYCLVTYGWHLSRQYRATESCDSIAVRINESQP